LPLQVFGNPLKVNETNRVGPHTHPTAVNDPGHDHKLPIGPEIYAPHHFILNALTGNPDQNQVSSTPAKTGIAVTTSENKGEPFPFVCVVVCTPVAQ
jgi:hypothetical protein